jgi:K+-transporting ATPase ATPase A chain
MIDAWQFVAVILILGSALVCGKLIAPYMAGVFTRAPSRMDRFLGPVEKLVYRLTGVDASHAMGWREYFLSGLTLNIAQMAVAFVILFLQGLLPINPQGFHGMS